MNQYIIKNRAEIINPIYKENKNYLNSIVKNNNSLLKITSSGNTSEIHRNSEMAEETINVIIDYFNEQSLLYNHFRKRVLSEIETLEFAYPTDNIQLEATIDVNLEKTFMAANTGMKNILDAFIKYSDFVSSANSNCLEDIDYVIEFENEEFDSSKIYLEQVIEAPWFN